MACYAFIDHLKPLYISKMCDDRAVNDIQGTATVSIVVTPF